MPYDKKKPMPGDKMKKVSKAVQAAQKIKKVAKKKGMMLK